MNLGYRFVEEGKTHVYLLKKKNAGGQLLVHMIESKLDHDAQCIKTNQLLIQFRLCGLWLWSPYYTEFLMLCLTFKAGQCFN